MEIIIVDKKYKGTFENDLELALSELLSKMREARYKTVNIVKINIFIDAGSNGDFFDQKDAVVLILEKYFHENMPSFSVIGQDRSAGNGILVEGYLMEVKAGMKIERQKFNKQPYVVISYDEGKRREIYSGGITSSYTDDFVHDCQRVLDFVEQLLMKEDMSFGNIITQWNYIPSIKGENRLGDKVLPNKQIFNDLKELYYTSADPENENIEVADIGTDYGGVTIDFIAIASEAGNDIKD